MSFSMDFSNDKPDIRDLIPTGTRVFVKMTYTPGGANLKNATVLDGALTKSKPTAENPNPDSKYLKAEFTVLRGPYKGRKFWSNMTVEGGKVDEKGNSIAAGITRQSLRLILDSAAGLSSKDESPEAKAKRVMPNGFRDLQGKCFVCKVGIEKGKQGYADKNKLLQVLTVDMKEFPKTEAELDNPNAGAVAADAPPAPVWGTPASAPVEPVAPVAIPQPTVAAPATTPIPAAAQDNIPAWAKAAA